MALKHEREKYGSVKEGRTAEQLTNYKKDFPAKKHEIAKKMNPHGLSKSTRKALKQKGLSESHFAEYREAMKDKKQ